jgi:glycine/D-amino acid oxidase-like deaminating enzyme
VPITRAWAGILPFTSDQAPVIDEVMPGLFVGAGHAFGNSSGPVTGRVLSQLIAGREPDFDISECRYGRPLDPIAVGAPTHW